MVAPDAAVPPVVILGPTASGKSDVAMACATAPDAGPCAIVAVDALQVYRHMDIGTAKPTVADRALVPHHGLDLVDPDQTFTVAEYAEAVRPVLDDLEHGGVRALLVAGTGLYLRALTDPMDLPGSWPEVRHVLEHRLATEGVGALYAELCALDPTAATKIDPANARRTVRALEVVIGSGRPFSSFGPGLDVYPPSRLAMFGLRWRRDLLAGRVAARVERMIEAGFVAEVEHLLARSGGLSRTAREALGYREIAAYLHGESSLDEAVALTMLHTRQFAVRQERWFRRDPRIQWIDVHDDPVAEAAPVIRKALRR